MISIDYIRENTDAVKNMLKLRKDNFDIDAFLKVDEDYKENLKKLEESQARRNILSKERTEQSIERAKKIKQDIADLTDIVAKVAKRRLDLWSRLPNLLDERVPQGNSDKDNVEIKKVGDIKKFTFTPKWHDELAINLGILDVKAGTKVSGSGFFYWKKDGARLLNALMNFTLDTMHKRGFEQMYTPILAKPDTFFGTGYLPFAQDQLYTLNADNLSLIGTSEQTLVAYHQNEIIDLSNPKKYTALTPCFRTEAGSYGKETRGIFRVHQFYKVEQIIFCKPEESRKYHDFCLETEETILSSLGLPYHVVNVCTGDLGNPASMKYDTEGWFAAYNGYRELTSNSNLLDYQTRRLNIRAKDENGKAYFPHTISATGITERALLAIIEYYQTENGDIEIPAVLQPYMNGQSIITKQ